MKKADIKQLCENGLILAANRDFFHPLGLSLVVAATDDGTYTFECVQGGTDDPERMLFDILRGREV